MKKVPYTRAARELNSLIKKGVSVALTRNKKVVAVLCPKGTEEYSYALGLMKYKSNIESSSSASCDPSEDNK